MDRNVYEFISQQNNDPIVERRTCTMSGQEFAIYQSEADFLNKMLPTFAGQTFTIPLPTLCPEERQRQRQMYRNERGLHRRKCNATGENIISVYSPDSIYKVYDQNFRRSDKRNALDYGKDFDFTRSFSSQFKEMHIQVPHLYLVNVDTENCYYTNFVLHSKNCYLVFGWATNENTSYGSFLVNVNNSLDMTSCSYCDFCYMCIDCQQCYNCRFTVNCKDCADCFMSEDCINCKHCISCFGLANSEYCFMNKKYSKEAFAKIEQDYKQLSWTQLTTLQNTFHQFKESLPHRAAYIYNSEHSTGNVLSDCKNCVSSFDVRNSEDCKYIYSCPNSTGAQDCVFTAPEGITHCYNVCSTVGMDIGVTTFMAWYGSYLFYCIECFNCNNCFWCVGLKGQQYCIFNKQYHKDEYEQQVAKIIAHMITTGERWQYFDPSICPFGYNEGVAQEYFPMTKNNALARWYTRQDTNQDPVIPEWVNVLTSDHIPDTITEVDDGILKRIFICEVSGRPFRIVQQELDFYRKLGIPLPRKHHDIRHLERLAQRPERLLHVRSCDMCGVEMLSIHDKDATFKVYCETCYNKEVYG